MIDWSAYTREQRVDITMQVTGLNRDEAELCVAIERGELPPTGDVLEPVQEGREAPELLYPGEELPRK